jgi:Xaa-Pro aminopeptidase
MFEAHFQTFEEPEGGVALTARLSALREELARHKLAGFILPRADRHQNEYVPALRGTARLADGLRRLGRAPSIVLEARKLRCSSTAATRFRFGEQVDGARRSQIESHATETAAGRSGWTRHLPAGDRS